MRRPCPTLASTRRRSAGAGKASRRAAYWSTPTGYLSFIFFFVMLAISLFACAQIGAARRQEAGQQLQALLALPVGRGTWLGGRAAGSGLDAAGAGHALAYPGLLEPRRAM